jgi:hypothetical protein
MSLVLVGHLETPIELALLRAAGALRLFNAYTGSPAAANQIAAILTSGGQLPFEPPTSGPDRLGRLPRHFPGAGYVRQAQDRQTLHQGPSAR